MFLLLFTINSRTFTTLLPQTVYLILYGKKKTRDLKTIRVIEKISKQKYEHFCGKKYAIKIFETFRDNYHQKVGLGCVSVSERESWAKALVFLGAKFLYERVCVFVSCCKLSFFLLFVGFIVLSVYLFFWLSINCQVVCWHFVCLPFSLFLNYFTPMDSLSLFDLQGWRFRAWLYRGPLRFVHDEDPE